MSNLTEEQKTAFNILVKERVTKIVDDLIATGESPADCAFILGVCANILRAVLLQISGDSEEKVSEYIRSALLGGFDGGQVEIEVVRETH